MLLSKEVSHKEEAKEQSHNVFSLLLGFFAPLRESQIMTNDNKKER